MAGVGSHLHDQVDQVAVGQRPTSPGMVLHVARPAEVLAHGVVFDGRVVKLLQDFGIGLVQHVGQHIEPSAVGHADEDGVYARLGRLV